MKISGYAPLLNECDGWGARIDEYVYSIDASSA